jgi:hypothetical protein
MVMMSLLMILGSDYCQGRVEKRDFPLPEEMMRNIHGLGLSKPLWEPIDYPKKLEDTILCFQTLKGGYGIESPLSLC